MTRKASECRDWEWEFVRKLKDNTPMDWIAGKLNKSVPEVIHMAAKLTPLSINR